MYKKGTIVLVPFPFTDLSGSKVRPAVIISKGKIGSDIIVVFITSQSKKRSRHSLTITPSEENGLKTTSQIHASKIATLEHMIVLGELGTLGAADSAKLDTILRTTLAL